MPCRRRSAMCSAYSTPSRFTFFQVGLWAAAMNDRFQRLGDLACGTMVVVEERAGCREWCASRPRGGAAGRAGPGRFPGQPRPGAGPGGLRRAAACLLPGRRLEIARHVARAPAAKFRFPPTTDLDMLLCGLYHHAFITDHDDAGLPGNSTFLEPRSPIMKLNESWAVRMG